MQPGVDLCRVGIACISYAGSRRKPSVVYGRLEGGEERVGFLECLIIGSLVPGGADLLAEDVIGCTGFL